MCSFSSSSVLHPGTFESKWVEFQRVLSCQSLRACLLVGLLFDGVCLFFLRQILILKSCSEKDESLYPHPTVRRAGTEFCKSSRQISSPACKNGPDVQLVASVVSASFILWFWNGSGDRGSEQCFRQAIAVEWVVKGTMSKKQSNLSHMLNNLLPGELAGRAPQVLPSKFCITWRAGTGSLGLPSLQLPGAALLPLKR